MLLMPICFGGARVEEKRVWVPNFLISSCGLSQRCGAVRNMSACCACLHDILHELTNENSYCNVAGVFLCVAVPQSVPSFCTKRNRLKEVATNACRSTICRTNRPGCRMVRSRQVPQANLHWKLGACHLLSSEPRRLGGGFLRGVGTTEAASQLQQLLQKEHDPLTTQLHQEPGPPPSPEGHHRRPTRPTRKTAFLHNVGSIAAAASEQSGTKPSTFDAAGGKEHNEQLQERSIRQ